MISNFVMGYNMKIHGKDTTGSSCDWARPATKTESESVHHRSRPKERDGHRSGRTEELRLLPHFASCCLPGFPGPFVPLHGIRGFQRIRIQRICSSDSLCLIQPFVFFLFVFDVTTHRHQQCVSAHLANSTSHISFNRLFFAGSWPLHSCL